MEYKKRPYPMPPAPNPPQRVLSREELLAEVALLGIVPIVHSKGEPNPEAPE